MSNVVAMTRAPIAEVENSQPFHTQQQLARLDQHQLVDLVLSLQSRTAVRHTAEGPMVRIQKLVRLAYGKAEDIYEVPKVGLMIQAKGYNRIAAEAGVQMLAPSTVMVDGEAKANPHIERDPITRSNKRCWVRRVAVWRGPQGTPMARDLTLIYDPGALFLVALRGKAEYNPADVKSVVRRLGDACPDGWAFFPEMEVPGTDQYVGLLVNVTNKDVGNAIKDRTDKSKFIERYAVTFCERNLLKKLIPVNTPEMVQGQQFATVPVTCWVASSDETFARSAQRAMMGVESPDNAIAGLTASGAIEVDAEEAHEDEVAVMHDATLGNEDAEPDDPARQYLLEPPAARMERVERKSPAPAPVPAEAPQTVTQAPATTTTAAAPVTDRAAHIASLQARLRAAREKIGESAFLAACECLEIDPGVGPRGTAKLEQLVAECESMVDEGGAA